RLGLGEAIGAARIEHELHRLARGRDDVLTRVEPDGRHGIGGGGVRMGRLGLERGWGLGVLGRRRWGFGGWGRLGGRRVGGAGGEAEGSARTPTRYSPGAARWARLERTSPGPGGRAGR